MGGKGRPKPLVGSKRLKAGKRPWAYLIPPLDKCRELMDFRLNGNQDWEEPFEWEEQIDDNPTIF